MADATEDRDAVTEKSPLLGAAAPSGSLNGYLDSGGSSEVSTSSGSGLKANRSESSTGPQRRSLDQLDRARLRHDMPGHGPLGTNLPVNVSPIESQTVWTEDRIDDQLLPPQRTLKKGATSNFQTMTHIFKGNVGTGILALPYAFSNIGIWMGFFGTIGIAVVAIHCIHCLVDASHFLCRVTGKETIDYGYCMDFAFKNVEGGGEKTKKTGRWMRKLVNLLLQITQFGFCCIYFVFMGDSLQQVVSNHVPSMENVSKQEYMAMILPFMLAFCCMRSVRKLSYFSTAANLMCIVGLVIIYYQVLRDLNPIDSVPAVTSDVTTWPLFLATTIYTFEGIGVILPLENKMKEPEALLPWNGVLNTAMTFVCSLFVSMGFYGYLQFGADCKASITLNLDSGRVINEVVKIMFAVAMFFTYALQLYVPVEIIWPILRKRVPREAWKKPLERVFRCFLVLCTYAIAAAIPHLGPFISLIGAFASSSLALLFPVLIDTLVRWRSRLGRFYWRLWKNLLIFLFGLVSFVIGTITSVNAIVVAFHEDANPTSPPPVPTTNLTLS